MERQRAGLRWSVEAGAARQLRADLPLAGGVLGACALAWMVLAWFSIGEVNGTALAFATRLMVLVTAICELGLLSMRAAMCARRGRLTLEYALSDDAIALTERSRYVHACILRLNDIDVIRRTHDGLMLRAGRMYMRVLCSEQERVAIEAAVCQARV